MAGRNAFPLLRVVQRAAIEKIADDLPGVINVDEHQGMKGRFSDSSKPRNREREIVKRLVGGAVVEDVNLEGFDALEQLRGPRSRFRSWLLPRRFRGDFTLTHSPKHDCQGPRHCRVSHGVTLPGSARTYTAFTYDYFYQQTVGGNSQFRRIRRLSWQPWWGWAPSARAGFSRTAVGSGCDS